MNVDLIFQIAGVGIIVAVLNQLLTRAGRDEQALLTTIDLWQYFLYCHSKSEICLIR